ncbi:GNAT family N-acetyltransferase [Skermania sp. ID1734]|uniref:GNAT family N-acetyltransferase n=1 Tax=Skermania sp. ID1734 TaxID=2597516 RepID=UPI00117C9BCE|nr:GNAT family N-acyltransferase [Skermania sp. ID1734]TSE01004.1 GNAT family N-acetyltransferase [Skermania sp. ID1734]
MTTTSVIQPVQRLLDTQRYSLVVASDAEHREAAQRLRFDVFAAEPGFAIPSHPSGRDVDRFDGFCDHLLVRDNATDEFVGCYRMLGPDQAGRAGGYYTATEFDITALDAQANRIVEMGRACVRPAHRNGSVLTLMWAGILRYIELTGYHWVMGCVSVPMQTTQIDVPGQNVRGVRDYLLSRHATAKRVRPYRPVSVNGVALDDIAAPAKPDISPLLRGYLRLGASICGEPAHDPDFGVADFVALLGYHEVNQRYLQRLQQAAASLDRPAG